MAAAIVASSQAGFRARRRAQRLLQNVSFLFRLRFVAAEHARVSTMALVTYTDHVDLRMNRTRAEDQIRLRHIVHFHFPTLRALFQICRP